MVSSVGYGVATAANALAVPARSRVLLLADDHSSPVLEWIARAEAGNFTVETVQRPGNGDRPGFGARFLSIDAPAARSLDEYVHEWAHPDALTFEARRPPNGR